MQSYLDLLKDVLVNGEAHADRTGVGTTSVFGRQWRHDMRTGFPLLTTKRVPLRWVFEELRWFLSGSDDVSELQKAGVDIWDEWATEEQCAKFGRKAGQLGPIYGPMMRNFPVGQCHQDGSDCAEEGYTVDGWHQVDQIAQLFEDIKTQPNSRRLIVTHWHPYYSKRVTLPPCHTWWQVKVHQRQDSMPDGLSLHLVCRSIDTFLGLPFDIASYAMLLEMLCAVLGMQARDLVVSISDLHVYNSHRDAVAIQLARPVRPLPRVRIKRECSGDPLENLLALTWDDIELKDYVPHSSIKAPVAI